MRKLSSEVKAGAILLFLAFVVLFISSNTSAIIYPTTSATNCQQSFSREASFNTQYYLCGNQYTPNYYNPYTYLQPSFIYPYNYPNYNPYLQPSFIKLPNTNSPTNIYTTNQRTGVPYCGDGVLNQGEQCDFGRGNGNSCENTPYGKECRECSIACGLRVIKEHCGDKIINGPEECDGGQLCNAQCKLEVECTFDLQCDDLDLCTNDFCDLGICKSELIDIDDNNLCTTDSCDFNNGIKHEPVNTDDLDICTDDICLPNAGVFNLPVDPSDGDLCTLDSCDFIQGILHDRVDSCSYFDINFEEDNPSFVNMEDEFPNENIEVNEEEIEEAECFQDEDCTDGGQCTQVACISGKCEEKERTGICDDGNECTFNDVCSEGICNGENIENIFDNQEELSCYNIKELRFDLVEEREEIEFRIDNQEKDNLLFLQGKDKLLIEMTYPDYIEQNAILLVKDFSLELNDEEIILGYLSFECKQNQVGSDNDDALCYSEISEDTLEKLDEAVKDKKSANLQIKIGDGENIEIVKEGYTHIFEDKGAIYSNYNGFTQGETIYFPEQINKKYIARNIRNKEAFEDKPVFFVSSNNWKDILSVESLANWKSSSSEEEWCVHPLENKEKCSYPTLIYSSSDFSDLSLDDGIIDLDYEFIKEFGSEKVFIIEEENSYNDETLKDLLEEKGISSSIISLNELYKEFFKSYGSFVYSENYNDALQGTLLSSYLNIPFVATEDEAFDDLFENGASLTIGHFRNEKIEDNQNKIYYHENEKVLSLYENYENIIEEPTFSNDKEVKDYLFPDKISPENEGIIFINSNDIYSSYCENTNKNGKSFYGLFCKSSLLSPEIAFMNDWPIYNIDLESGDGFLAFEQTAKEYEGLERDKRATERAETAKALIETSLEDFKSKISSNDPKEIFYLLLGGQKAIPYFRTSIAVDENNKVHLERIGSYPTLLMGEDVPILVNFDRYYLGLEEDPFEETDGKSYNVERIYGATPLSNSIFISQTHLLNTEDSGENENCEDENCAVASHPYKAPTKYLRGLIEDVRAFRLFRMFGLLSSPSDLSIKMDYTDSLKTARQFEDWLASNELSNFDSRLPKHFISEAMGGAKNSFVGFTITKNVEESDFMNLIHEQEVIGAVAYWHSSMGKIEGGQIASLEAVAMIDQLLGKDALKNGDIRLNDFQRDQLQGFPTLPRVKAKYFELQSNSKKLTTEFSEMSLRLHQSLNSIAKLKKEEISIHQKYVQLVERQIYEGRVIGQNETEYETLKKTLLEKEFKLSQARQLLKSQFPILESERTTFMISIKNTLQGKGITAISESYEVNYDKIELLEVQKALREQLEQSRALLIGYIDESQKAIKYLNDPSFEYDRWGDLWIYDEHPFIAEVLKKSPPLKQFEYPEGISNEEHLKRAQANYYFNVVQNREIIRGLYEDGSDALIGLSINTALVIGTAGLGTGIAEARAGLASIRAGKLTSISKTEFAGAAILGSNSAWTALSFRESYSICNQAFKIKEIPIGPKAPKDLLNSLGKNFVNDYQSCIIGIAFNTLDLAPYIPPFANQFIKLKEGQTIDPEQLKRSLATQTLSKENGPIQQSSLLNGKKIVSASDNIKTKAIPNAKFILSKASNGYGQFVPIKLFYSIPETEQGILQLFATELKNERLRGAKAIVGKEGRIVFWKGDADDPHHLGITGRLYAEQHPKEFQQFQQAEAKTRPGYVRQEGYTHDYIEKNFDKNPELQRYYGYQLQYDPEKKVIYFLRDGQTEVSRTIADKEFPVKKEEFMSAYNYLRNEVMKANQKLNPNFKEDPLLHSDKYIWNIENHKIPSLFSP